MHLLVVQNRATGAQIHLNAGDSIVMLDDYDHEEYVGLWLNPLGIEGPAQEAGQMVVNIPPHGVVLRKPVKITLFRSSERFEMHYWRHHVPSSQFSDILDACKISGYSKLPLMQIEVVQENLETAPMVPQPQPQIEAIEP